MVDHIEHLELCDDCGIRFELDTDCFIGDWDNPSDDSCSPFTQIISLCAECYSKRRSSSGG